MITCIHVLWPFKTMTHMQSCVQQSVFLDAFRMIFFSWRILKCTLTFSHTFSLARMYYQVEDDRCHENKICLSFFWSRMFCVWGSWAKWCAQMNSNIQAIQNQGRIAWWLKTLPLSHFIVEVSINGPCFAYKVLAWLVKKSIASLQDYCGKRKETR